MLWGRCPLRTTPKKGQGSVSEHPGLERDSVYVCCLPGGNPLLCRELLISYLASPHSPHVPSCQLTDLTQLVPSFTSLCISLHLTSPVTPITHLTHLTSTHFIRLAHFTSFTKLHSLRLTHFRFLQLSSRFIRLTSTHSASFTSPRI